MEKYKNGKTYMAKIKVDFIHKIKNPIALRYRVSAVKNFPN